MLPIKMAQNRIAAGIGDDADHAIVAAATVPQPSAVMEYADARIPRRDGVRALSFARMIDVRAAIENDPPKLEFVLHGLMRRYAAGIIAPGGTGKSYLMLGIGCEVATGGGYSEIGLIASGAAPSKVLYLSAEEDDAVLQDRIHKIGAHLDKKSRDLVYENFDVRSTLGTTPALVNRNLEPNESVIDELIATLQGYALVIIDPLRKWHDGDENQSADATVLTKTFDRIAHSANCALVFAHHASKAATLGGNGDLAAASRGSVALTDNIRLQINLSSLDAKQLSEYELGKNDARWFVALDFAKINHVAPEGTRILRRRDDGTLYRDEAVENAREIRQIEKRARRSKTATTLAAQQDENGLVDTDDIF